MKINWLDGDPLINCRSIDKFNRIMNRGEKSLFKQVKFKNKNQVWTDEIALNKHQIYNNIVLIDFEY